MFSSSSRQVVTLCLSLSVCILLNQESLDYVTLFLASLGHDALPYNLFYFLPPFTSQYLAGKLLKCKLNTVMSLSSNSLTRCEGYRILTLSVVDFVYALPIRQCNSYLSPVKISFKITSYILLDLFRRLTRLPTDLIT